MIEAGSRLSTRTFGPWIAWTAAGRPDADPYTRAHTARNGLLPVSSTLELTFRAKTDSRGGRLSSSCDYTIVLQDPEPAWWSLAVFDGQGRLVQNGAERHAFNNRTAHARARRPRRHRAWRAMPGPATGCPADAAAGSSSC